MMLILLMFYDKYMEMIDPGKDFLQSEVDEFSKQNPNSMIIEQRRLNFL